MFGNTALAEPNPAQIQALQEQAREQAATMQLPGNIHREEGVRAARETNAGYRSQEFQDKLCTEQERLQASMGKTGGTGERSPEALLSADERLYLFLSSSVPEDTVRNLLSALEGTPIVPVLRGMPGDLQEMARWYIQVTKKDPSCQDSQGTPCDRYKAQIRIEPGLFTEYGIEAVPALVYGRRDELLLIQGDAGLAALLGRINREAHSPGLEQLIQTLQKQ